MKTRVHKTGIATLSVLVLTLVGIPAIALGAANPHARADAQAVATEKRAVAQERLTDAKLRVCQNREKAITNIMARIGDRGQKQVDLFSTIADKVEAFYTDKGKTLSTYDTLVANVATQKAAAQTAVDAVKAAGTGFSCESTNPKGVVSSFKQSLKSEIDALKAYKTAVKDLIVGVKSVQSTVVPDATGAEGSN